MERKNRLWLFFALYFFYWAAENCLSPYLGLYYRSIGLGDMQIAMASAVFSVACVSASVLIGLLGDRLHRPRALLLLLMLGALAGTGLLYRLRSLLLVFCGVFLYGFFSSPVNGIADKVLMDRLAQTPERFSLYRLGGTAGAGAGVLLAGFLLRRDTSLLPVFLGYWVLMLLCALCVCPLPCGSTLRAERSRLRDYAEILRRREALPYYVVYAVFGFCESAVTQFLALLLTHCGYPSSLTSLLVAAAMVGEFLSFLLAPRLQRRFSPSLLLSLAFLLQFLRVASLSLLLWLPLPLVLFFQLIGGSSFAIIYALVTQEISRSFPPEISYSAHTLKYLANRGVGMTLGTLLLGAFFERGHPLLGYGILAATAGLMIALCRPLLRGKRSRT